MVVVVGGQGGGQVLGINRSSLTVTHKDLPSNTARCCPPVSTDLQACRVGGIIPLPGGGS